jgi:hypothetical protein
LKYLYFPLYLQNIAYTLHASAVKEPAKFAILQHGIKTAEATRHSYALVSLKYMTP